jgi:hypothetical protein
MLDIGRALSPGRIFLAGELCAFFSVETKFCRLGSAFKRPIGPALTGAWPRKPRGGRRAAAPRRRRALPAEISGEPGKAAGSGAKPAARPRCSPGGAKWSALAAEWGRMAGGGALRHAAPPGWSGRHRTVPSRSHGRAVRIAPPAPESPSPPSQAFSRAELETGELCTRKIGSNNCDFSPVPRRQHRPSRQSQFSRSLRPVLHRRAAAFGDRQ